MTTLNIESLINQITTKRASEDSAAAPAAPAPADTSTPQKQASVDLGTPEGLKASIDALSPEVKAACMVEALTMLQADDARLGLATAVGEKSAGQTVDFQTLTAEEKASFENAFNDHSAKLASENPDYALFLNIEAVKMAFDQGAEDAEQEVLKRASEKTGQ